MSDHEKTIDEISLKLSKNGVPHFIAIATGKTHADDGGDVVSVWHNLQDEDQLKSLSQMVLETDLTEI